MMKASYGCLCLLVILLLLVPSEASDLTSEETGAAQVSEPAVTALGESAKAATTVDGCRLPPSGIGGVCGGTNGFALAACGGLKIQGKFNVTSFSCADKTLQQLDACAAEYEGGSDLSDSCKISTLDFKVEGENSEDTTFAAQRAAGTIQQQQHCNGNISHYADSWYLTALELVQARAATLCQVTSESVAMGRRLLAKAASGTVLSNPKSGNQQISGGGHASAQAQYQGLDTCSEASCTATSTTCPSGTRRRRSSASGSQTVAYTCSTGGSRRLLQVKQEGKLDKPGGLTVQQQISPTPAPTPAPTTVRRRALTTSNAFSAGFDWNCSGNQIPGCYGSKFSLNTLEQASVAFAAGIGDTSVKVACSSAKKSTSCTYQQPQTHAPWNHHTN